MLGPGETVLQHVGDPAGAIDEQCRDDWRFVQLTHETLQALRRKSILASPPFRRGGRRFGRSSALRASCQLVRDPIGLQGKAVALGTGCKERREQDARFVILDGDGDDNGASFERA